MHRSTLVCNKSRQFDARHMHKHAHTCIYGRTHEYCTITTITTPVALTPYPDSLNARMSTIAIDTTSRGRGPLSCTGLPTARHSQVIRNRGSRSTEPIQYYHPLITAKAQSPVNCRSFTPNVCVFQTVPSNPMRPGPAPQGRWNSNANSLLVLPGGRQITSCAR